jgi:hypothetical protein
MILLDISDGVLGNFACVTNNERYDISSLYKRLCLPRRIEFDQSLLHSLRNLATFAFTGCGPS